MEQGELWSLNPHSPHLAPPLCARGRIGRPIQIGLGEARRCREEECERDRYLLQKPRNSELGRSTALAGTLDLMDKVP